MLKEGLLEKGKCSACRAKEEGRPLRRIDVVPRPPVRGIGYRPGIKITPPNPEGTRWVDVPAGSSDPIRPEQERPREYEE